MTRLSVVMILVALFVGAAGSYLLFAPSHGTGENGAAAGDKAPDYYTCPMHPSVRSDRPGACPVCGMALVRKSAMQESGDLASLRRVSLSPTQRVLANISTVPVERRTVQKAVRAVGFLSVAEPLQSTVAARFRGRLEKLHVTYSGATVRKGEPLLGLYSPDLVSAEREYLIALDGIGTTGKELLDAAADRLRIHFGLTQAQVVELENTRTVHRTLVFYSPISGTVLEKNVQEGEYVDEGMVMYRLADLSRIWAQVDIYEKDIRFVSVGRQVRITADAFPGEVVAGRVTFVDPVVNADTRTVRVRVELPNPRGRLRPNMYVQAEIAVPAREALVVPIGAVLATGTRDVVWVEAENNVFEPRHVRVGFRSDRYAQVLDGLYEGELVAATGGYLIDSESALQNPSGADPHAGHGGLAASTRNSEGVKGPGGAAAESRGQVQGALPAENPPATKALAPGASGASGKNSAPVPRTGQEHSGHTHGAALEGDSGSGNGSDVVKIVVKSGYAPGAIRVKAGKPLTLEFTRQEESVCSEEIVFPTLNIKRRLPAFRTTVIRLGPQKPGEVPFECGMGMLEGKLVVER